MPRQWSRHIDEESGNEYFVDSETGESVWERPEDYVDNEVLSQHDGVGYSADVTDHTHEHDHHGGEGAGEATGEQPQGRSIGEFVNETDDAETRSGHGEWKKVWSDEQQDYYYEHLTTGETSWHTPRVEEGSAAQEHAETAEHLAHAYSAHDSSHDSSSIKNPDSTADADQSAPLADSEPVHTTDGGNESDTGHADQSQALAVDGATSSDDAALQQPGDVQHSTSSPLDTNSGSENAEAEDNDAQPSTLLPLQSDGEHQVDQEEPALQRDSADRNQMITAPASDDSPGAVEEVQYSEDARQIEEQQLEKAADEELKREEQAEAEERKRQEKADAEERRSREQADAEERKRRERTEAAERQRLELEKERIIAAELERQRQEELEEDEERMRLKKLAEHHQRQSHLLAAKKKAVALAAREKQLRREEEEREAKEREQRRIQRRKERAAKTAQQERERQALIEKERRARKLERMNKLKKFTNEFIQNRKVWCFGDCALVLFGTFWLTIDMVLVAAGGTTGQGMEENIDHRSSCSTRKSNGKSYRCPRGIHAEILVIWIITYSDSPPVARGCEAFVGANSPPIQRSTQRCRLL